MKFIQIMHKGIMRKPYAKIPLYRYINSESIVLIEPNGVNSRESIVTLDSKEKLVVCEHFVDLVSRIEKETKVKETAMSKSDIECVGTTKKFYAVNRETGEKWKPSEFEEKQYLVMLDTGNLAVVTEGQCTYVDPLDTLFYKKIIK